MKLLTAILIVNSIGILAIYLSYKFFNWLLIDKNPISNKDQSLHKPYFFARENEKLAEKDLKDQNNFALTEISNSAQMFDKTTQNDSINNNILIYNNKTTKL